MKKNLFAIIIFSFCLMALTACSTTDDAATTRPEISTANTISKGNSLELGTQKVKFKDFQENKGQVIITPASGNVFVFIEVEVENLDKETIHVDMYEDFIAYCNGEKINLSGNALLLAENADGEDFSTAVGPGRSITYILAYEIPANYSEIAVHYDINDEQTIALVRKK